MIYQYKCNKCEKTFDVDLDPNKDLPKELPCEDKACKGKLSRVWMINSIIPEYMKATSGNQVNYEKRNQIHGKKYY